MHGITPKQREVLDFIAKYVKKHRCSPSYREIAKGINLASPGNVHRYIQALADRGWLTVDHQKARSVWLNEFEPRHSGDAKTPMGKGKAG